jgi:hypothetical protein
MEQDQEQEPEPFERFSIYRFSVDYPAISKLELNPKSKRNQGDIAFKVSPGYIIFLSWGEMEKIKPKFANPSEHATFSINRVRKSGAAKGFNELERRPQELNGHQAIFTHIRMEPVRRGLFGRPPDPQEVRSFHLHCLDSSRYFVLYGSIAAARSEEQSAVIQRMIESLTCHHS